MEDIPETHQNSIHHIYKERKNPPQAPFPKWHSNPVVNQHHLPGQELQFKILMEKRNLQGHWKECGTTQGTILIDIVTITKIENEKTPIHLGYQSSTDIWHLGNTCKTCFNRRESKQNKFIRLVAPAPWFIRNSQLRREMKLPTLKEFATTALHKLIQRTESTDNQTLQEALPYITDPSPNWLSLLNDEDL